MQMADRLRSEQLPGDTWEPTDVEDAADLEERDYHDEDRREDKD
jgi:hypothetical protein